MWISIDNIKDFYDTEVGVHFASAVNEIIDRYRAKKIVSIGYNQGRDIPTIIPAKHGLMDGTILAHETMLPIADNSIDVVLVLHTLEYTVDIKLFFNEVYRILKSYGTAIFIFPNLYANIVVCHNIFKHNRCEAYIKRQLQKNSFLIKKINYLSPFKRLFSGSVKDIVSVITTQKQESNVINVATNSKIPVNINI